MNLELALMNEKSSTELEIMNDDNNTVLITSSINLTEATYLLIIQAYLNA